MPAAAVIPAPKAYTKVVAVKKLVVGSQGDARGRPFAVATARVSHRPPVARALRRACVGCGHVYFEKIRVFKAGAYRSPAYPSME